MVEIGIGAGVSFLSALLICIDSKGMLRLIDIVAAGSLTVESAAGW